MCSCVSRNAQTGLGRVTLRCNHGKARLGIWKVVVSMPVAKYASLFLPRETRP